MHAPEGLTRPNLYTFDYAELWNHALQLGKLLPDGLFIYSYEDVPWADQRFSAQVVWPAPNDCRDAPKVTFDCIVKRSSPEIISDIKQQIHKLMGDPRKSTHDDTKHRMVDHAPLRTPDREAQRGNAGKLLSYAQIIQVESGEETLSARANGWRDPKATVPPIQTLAEISRDLAGINFLDTTDGDSYYDDLVEAASQYQQCTRPAPQGMDWLARIGPAYTKS